MASDRRVLLGGLGALVPPAPGVLLVVQTVELVRVVIQPIGGVLGLVVILAMVASRCPLPSALAHDVQLLAGQLDDLESIKQTAATAWTKAVPTVLEIPISPQIPPLI